MMRLLPIPGKQELLSRFTSGFESAFGDMLISLRSLSEADQYRAVQGHPIHHTIMT